MKDFQNYETKMSKESIFVWSLHILFFNVDILLHLVIAIYFF